MPALIWLIMERRSLYETWPAEPGAPSAAAGGRVYLDAEVRPNRSLPNPGFVIFMAAVAGVSVFAGAGFVMMGAWPVLGFFGLDIFLLWLAFRLSYRDGRRVEVITVRDREIRVDRRTSFGHATTYRVPVAFTRVEIVGRGEPDVQARLAHSGKHLIIGSVLSPREREALAEAVLAAVQEARRPGLSPSEQEPGGAPA